MTNGDTPQHEAHESGEQKSQNSFNVDNLAQKGAPTYVAFKSSEEYMDNTNRVEETSQNNGSWKMSKLKSLFNKSNPDLSNKPADTKNSIKKWFSFSKFEDISKRQEEGTHKTLSLQDSNDNVTQINERQKISDIGVEDRIKKVEIFSNKDKISQSETCTKNHEEITKDTKEEIFLKIETNEEKSNENIGYEEPQNAFDQINDFSGIQVNVPIPIPNAKEEENQEKSFKNTEDNSLNMCDDNLDEEHNSNGINSTTEVETVHKEDKISNGDTLIEKLEKTSKDILQGNLATFDLSSKDFSYEGEENTDDITTKMTFDDSFLNITGKNYENNENEHIQTIQEECNDSEDQGKSSKAEVNSINKRICIDILDDEQNLIPPKEEYQSINLEDRYNPWTMQSLYEIPEENEDETSLDNNSYPDYGFPTLINDATLKTLNDFEGNEDDSDERLNKAGAMPEISPKQIESSVDIFTLTEFLESKKDKTIKSINDFEENISKTNRFMSNSESESEKIMNKTDETFDPWNESTKTAFQQIELNRIESFDDSFKFTENKKVEDFLTTETEDSSPNIYHLIIDILEHIIIDIIVLKEDQSPMIDPFTDQNSIKLSMSDINDTYGQEGQDGELCDIPTAILSNLSILEENFSRRHSQLSESTASEDNYANEANEQFLKERNLENDADFEDYPQDHAQEPFLSDKRVMDKQDSENVENEEGVKDDLGCLCNSNIDAKEQDPRQESCPENKEVEHDLDDLEDIEIVVNDIINVHDTSIGDISLQNGLHSVVYYNEKASGEERVDIQEPNLESSEEEQIALASDADDENVMQKDEKKRKSLKKRVKKALSFKGPRKAIQKLLVLEDKKPNKTTQRKKKKSNGSEVYDSEFFPPEAREEQESNLTRSFSLSMLKTQKQLSGLSLKRKFHSLGRATKPPPPSFFDSTSLNSSLSAPFPHSAPQSEIDNIRLKVGQSTFYLLSDEVQIQGQLINKNKPPLSTGSKDDFDLIPLEVKEAPSEAGSDCVDSGVPDHIEDAASNEIIIESEPELLSVYSNSDTDYFSIASSDSSTNLDTKSIQIQRLTRSLDDISMLRMKKKKFSVSNEFLENQDQIAFHSIGHNDDEVSRTLSSSHPHLYNTNGNSLVIINSNSNKSSWKPFKKLKQIFKPPSKLTEASVYSDTYLQKDPQVNQNPIYIASPEEELQEVTGFPNHQTPFSRHNLGKIAISDC